MKKIIPFLLAVLLAFGAYIGLDYYGDHRDAPVGQEFSVERDAVNVYELPEAVGEDVTETSVEAEESVLEGSTEGRYGEIVAQEEGLTIYRLQGKRYKGLLAEITQPERLTVGVSGVFYEDAVGKQVGEIGDSYGAILTVNGGAFYDPDGNGLGGCPTGNVIVDGDVLWSGYEDTIGMDANGKLYCGLYNISDCQERGLVWALSYTPTLVIDGQVQSVRTDLEEPRTAVGQREDGAILILCLQGRQPSALGLTEQDLAQLMLDLGCVNAGNLDGGASSYMVYHGEYINIANTGGNPRPIPTVLMFMPKEEVTE